MVNNQPELSWITTLLQVLSLAIKHPCEVCIVFVVNVCDSRIVRLLLFISICAGC